MITHLTARTTYTFEFYKDSHGDHRWRLKARNGRIVADSGEGYSSKAKCTKAARNLAHAVLAMGDDK